MLKGQCLKKLCNVNLQIVEDDFFFGTAWVNTVKCANTVKGANTVKVGKVIILLIY